MALFGHDDNVRRLSSNLSTGAGPNFDDDVTGDDVTAGCCGCSRGRGHHGSKEKKCTASKIKSCLKLFFAQLFSHVGLCALVVGYSIMGAFIFVYLEKENELQTRLKVEDTRKVTLDQLYGITAPLRLQVILQDERIQRLKNQTKEITRLLRTCRRQQKRERQFLKSVVSNHLGDNVPMSPENCLKTCADKKVGTATCIQVCQISSEPCTYWQEVIATAKLKQSSKVSEKSVVFHSSSRTTETHRLKRMSEAQVILAANQTNLDGPLTTVLAEPGQKKKRKFVSIIPHDIPEPLPIPPNPGRN